MSTSGTNESKSNVETVINRVALLYAMIDEAQPLIEKLKLTKNAKYASEMKPFPVFSNADQSIFLVVNGKCDQYKCDRVATQWATLSTYLTIRTLSPDVVINAGSCGGIVPEYVFGKKEDSNKSDSDLYIADVFVGEKVLYSDRRIPLPAWTKWATGHYKLFGANYLSQKIKGLKKSPCIASSNSFDFTKEDIEIYKANNVNLKDMECAAIAEFCKHFDCKLIAIKGVTDLVAHHDAKHFEENLSKTVRNVADMVQKVISEIFGKKMSEIETSK
eukprot:CAMPEP_0202702676 /NCGR_PEP_ID=MMETSP1385-20130828/15622_1 /ASSEMBLY_ACC=CAM_ASM_000861 /TAXON_ID=933848 /ORGANISM="Elphidium margaritaceum" /LENGTH=273 /DNA_ID=CAMNT_0049360367 /DNA_START=23 /DNA_END=844 /DNA_ORIENTATION=-